MKYEILTVGSKKIAVEFDENLYADASAVLLAVQTYRTNLAIEQTIFDQHQLDFNNEVINQAQFDVFINAFKLFQDTNQPTGYSAEPFVQHRPTLRELTILQALILNKTL